MKGSRSGEQKRPGRRRGGCGSRGRAAPRDATPGTSSPWSSPPGHVRPSPPSRPVPRAATGPGELCRGHSPSHGGTARFIQENAGFKIVSGEIGFQQLRKSGCIFFPGRKSAPSPLRLLLKWFPRASPGSSSRTAPAGTGGTARALSPGPPPHPSARKNRDWHHQHPAPDGGAASAPPLPSGHNSGVLGTTRAFRRSRMWLFNVTAERGGKTSLLPLTPHQHLWDHRRQPHVPVRICPCSAAMPTS